VRKPSMMTMSFILLTSMIIWSQMNTNNNFGMSEDYTSAAMRVHPWQ
jgi:hypothetical protein